MNYDYKQLHFDRTMEEIGRPAYTVKGYKKNGYPETSVCHGMTRIDCLDSYANEKNAVKEHPELVTSDGEVSWGCAYMDRELKNVQHINQ